MNSEAEGRASSRAGFTLLELLIVVGILATLAALAAAFLMAARKSANEASAVATLRAINSGQFAFAASCGSNNYADGLAVLVAGNYISPDANLSPKSGYTFSMTAGPAAAALGCAAAPTHTSYYVSASPLSAVSGTRAFATNQAGSIWQNTAGVPPGEPFAEQGTVGPLGSH
jgi:prepilin-type N-terminal cleavage/methylation domain-containing protein